MSQVPFDLYGNAYQKGDLPRKYSICHPRHGEPVVQCPELIKHGSAIANIVICAYGTWNRPEEDLQKDLPTNVLNWLAPINPVAVRLDSRFL